VLQPTKDFRMQRLAEPWKLEEDLPPLDLRAGDYFTTDYQNGELLPEESARIMTVDCQQDHYWGVVRVWLKNGYSKLIWAGMILTPEQIREIQTKLKIPDKRTLLDAGNSFHGRIYDVCARYGWTALIGRAEDHFTVRGQDGKPIRRYYSAPDRVVAPTTRDSVGKRVFVTFFYWSSDPIKDILGNLRNIGSPVWEFPQDVCLEYKPQINSEAKKATVDKRTKKTRLRWTATGRHNHLWDAEAMNVLAAQILGILPDMASTAPEVDEPAPTE
jgi:hypothetical protein